MDCSTPGSSQSMGFPGKNIRRGWLSSSGDLLTQDRNPSPAFTTEPLGKLKVERVKTTASRPICCWFPTRSHRKAFNREWEQTCRCGALEASALGWQECVRCKAWGNEGGSSQAVRRKDTWTRHHWDCAAGEQLTHSTSVLYEQRRKFHAAESRWWEGPWDTHAWGLMLPRYTWVWRSSAWCSDFFRVDRLWGRP